MVYVFACASLLATCLVQTLASLPPLWIWSFPALAGLILLYKFPNSAIRAASIALFGFAILGFWGQFRSLQQLESYLPKHQEIILLPVTGMIVDIPARSQQRVRLRVKITESPIKELKPGTHIFLNHYTTRVSTSPPPYRSGQEWKFAAKLKRPHGLLNPGGRDTEAWLWAEGIRATGSIKTASFVKECLTLRCKIAGWREQLSLSIQDKLQGREYAGLISALVVGDSNAIPQKQWTLFGQTGVIHLISISGLHITLIAGLVAAIACWIWKRIPNAALQIPTQRIGFYTGVIAAFIYALMAGFSVPTQRTLFMLITLGISYFWGQKNLMQSLAWALIVVLLYDPLAILSAGTWLSFGAVAVMSIGAQGQLGQRPSFQEWGRAQWAVTLGLIPALLLYFGQLPLSSPIANAIAIPVVSGLVTPLALLGALTNTTPPLVWAEQLTQLLSIYLNWCAQIGIWNSALPPLGFAIMACFGASYSLLAKGLPCRYLGLLLFLPILSTQSSPLKSGEWKATVLDVGQGLAVLVQTQNSNTLYDTGPDWPGDGDSGVSTVLPALRALGVKKLEDLILSHNDNDHTGGAKSVLAAMPTKRLYTSLPDNHSLRGQIGLHRPCLQGDQWSQDLVNFKVLSPLAKTEAHNDNDRSCVIKITSDQGSLLLTGDISADKEREIIEQRQDLRSTVLIAPHHGSKRSSTSVFITQTAAQAVIFSSGYRNHFNHPHPDVIARYQVQKQYRTDLEGAIHIQFQHGQLEIITENSLSRRFWRSE